jgi:hypothetical protein
MDEIIDYLKTRIEYNAGLFERLETKKADFLEEIKECDEGMAALRKESEEYAAALKAIEPLRPKTGDEPAQQEETT